MTVRTIKMLKEGTAVDFYLTMNPRLRQKRPFRGIVINYPPGHFTQKILMKDRKVAEVPVILIRIKAKEGEFVIDARGVKALEPAKVTKEEIEELQAILDE